MNEHYQLSTTDSGKEKASNKSGDCKYFYKIVVLVRTGKKTTTNVLVISYKFEMFCTHVDSCRFISPDGNEFWDLASASFAVQTGCSDV